MVAGKSLAEPLSLRNWDEGFPCLLQEQLHLEARRRFSLHELPRTRSAWEGWRHSLRERLWANLGTPPCHELDLDVQVLKTLRMEGYRVECVVYQSRPGFYVTGNLYVPDGEGPFPAVLNLHGHFKQGRLAERIQCRGHSLARSGYVCLAVDAFGSGERATVHGEYEYHGGNLGSALFDVGETLMGMQLVDNLRGIDLLCSLPFVDPNRIGVTGASGGGNQTMWVAAMDDRITAAVPVVSVGTFETCVVGRNCVCETLPDVVTCTETAGILALVAPRALKLCNALEDWNPTFHPREMLRSYAGARPVYQLLATDAKLAYQIFNRPHGYWPEVREAMLGWFDHWLKGEGDGAPRKEASFTTLSEETLMCFEKGHRPATVQSVATFCRERGHTLRQEFREDQSLDAGAKRAALRRLLRIGNPHVMREAEEEGAIEIEGIEWQRVNLFTTGGDAFPLLWRAPEHEDAKTFVVGRLASEATPVREELIRQKLREGGGVLFFSMGLWQDQDSDAGTDHNLARSCWWMGRSLLGEWVRGLSLMSAFLRERCNRKNATLLGSGEDALAALMCGAIGDERLGIEVYTVPGSYCFGTKPTALSMGVHVPGFLQWGDVSLAMALCEGEVRVVGPVHMDGRPYSPEETEALAEETKALRARCGLGPGHIRIQDCDQDYDKEAVGGEHSNESGL